MRESWALFGLGTQPRAAGGRGVIPRSVSRTAPDRGHHGSAARQTGKRGGESSERRGKQKKRHKAPFRLGPRRSCGVVYGLLCDSMGRRRERQSECISTCTSTVAVNPQCLDGDDGALWHQYNYSLRAEIDFGSTRVSAAKHCHIAHCRTRVLVYLCARVCTRNTLTFR